MEVLFLFALDPRQQLQNTIRKGMILIYHNNISQFSATWRAVQEKTAFQKRRTIIFQSPHWNGSWKILPHPYTAIGVLHVQKTLPGEPPTAKFKSILALVGVEKLDSLTIQYFKILKLLPRSFI